MSNPYSDFAIVTLLLSVLMILLQLGAAAVSLVRFRATLSGLLMTSAFGGFAVIGIIHRVLPVDMIRSQLAPVAFGLLDLLLTIVLAVGLAFIPKSLTALSKRA